MSRHFSTMKPDLFAGYYAVDPDPWRFTTSEYERDKYAATVASLPRQRYRAGLEIGCSIGVLTRQFAQRCTTLVSTDVVESALDSARATCHDQSNVTFELSVAPEDWPEGKFDLVVLSEVLCFFDRADLARMVARVEGSLLPGGDVILVNWLGETNFPLTGDEASDGFIGGAAGFAHRTHQERTDKYRLDVLTRGMNGKSHG